MKRYFGYISSLIIILISLVVTIYVRSTLIDDNILLEKSLNSYYNIPELNTEMLNISNIPENNKDSTLFLKVKLLQYKNFYNSSRLSEFYVINDFSDKNLSNKNIFISEPIQYLQKENKFLVYSPGYIPMLKGDEYYVVLDKKPYYDPQNIFDLPVYNLNGDRFTSFSKFNVVDKNNFTLKDNYSFTDFEKIEIATNDKSIHKKYIETKNTLLGNFSK